MGSESVKSPVSLTIDGDLYRRLSDHLFPGDHDEHGAVISAGITTSLHGTRLLARDLFIARDGIDYVPGTRGYRALTPAFVASCISYCADEDLCYLAVHCHGGTDSVQFSGDDMASHERGYPALLDISNGGPVGALVFTTGAIAGDAGSTSVGAGGRADASCALASVVIREPAAVTASSSAGARLFRSVIVRGCGEA